MRNKKYPLYDTAPEISSFSDMLEKKAETMPEKVAFRYRKGRDKVEEKTYGEVFREVKKQLPGSVRTTEQEIM